MGWGGGMGLWVCFEGWGQGNRSGVGVWAVYMGWMVLGVGGNDGRWAVDGIYVANNVSSWRSVIQVSNPPFLAPPILNPPPPHTHTHKHTHTHTRRPPTPCLTGGHDVAAAALVRVRRVGHVRQIGCKDRNMCMRF